MEKIGYILNGRLILIGDHTKNVKDGRKIPAVTTLHQDSETGSKPKYFRGHFWGSICIVAEYAKKCIFLPLWAEIHPEGNLKESRATRIINQANEIARQFGQSIYLVLDAFFCSWAGFLNSTIIEL